MKRLLLSLFIAFISLSVVASEAPIFNWGAFVKTGGSMTTSPSSIKKNEQNELFAFGTFASHTTNGLVTSYKLVPYNAAETPELATPSGAPYTGTGSNNNFFLYKIDEDGKPLWQVTSNMGDISTNNSAAVPTIDGGVFLALKVRHTNKNENNNDILLGIVDADGNSTNVTWAYPGFWGYQGVFVKISSTGKVEWTKLISVSTEIMDYYTTSKTEIVDGFAFNDLAADELGNIYLAGSYVNKITFGTKTLVPHNGEGWGGDTQYAQNDLFVVKLSDAGEYVWDLVSTGQVKNETANSISYDNGYVYILGNLAGDEVKTMQLGSYSASPTAKIDAYTAKIKASDASVEWFKHFRSLPLNNVGGRIKIVSTQFDNGSVLTAGSFTGIITDANKQTITTNTNGTFLQGFIIKQDAANGDIQATAIAPIGGISEFSTGFYYDNKINVVGYLSSQYYITYDSDLTNPTAPFDLLTGANSFDACLVNDQLIAFGRGRGTLGYPTESLTESVSAFSSVLSSYTLPKASVGLEVVEKDNNNIKVTANNGVINVEFDGLVNIALYSIDGRLIDNSTVSDNYSKSVEKGIYVLSVNNKTFKIAVR